MGRVSLKFTFRRGIHPAGNKQIAKDIALLDFPTPAVVSIPLSQHIGAPASVVVAVGDDVKVGTLLGKATGFVSANVFSSVSGKVKEIVSARTAIGSRATHVVIENDGLYEESFLTPLTEPDAAAIKTRVAEAGIVGMGGATFPTHVKLSPRTPVDVLIINAAECEPYITCDYRLCLEKTAEIFAGVKYMMTALGVSVAYIGVEDNKPDAIKALSAFATDAIKVVPLVTKYPQGAEKQLIYSITRRVVPEGALPSDVGAVVDNVHTAFAIYEAVALGKPSFMRAMTVSGKGCAHPGNFWVRNGVGYRDIAEFCGVSDSVKKVISGGPMMGFAQADLTPSTGKGTSSLLFLTEEEVSEGDKPISACINCASCAAHCPMRLMPMFIERAVDAEDALEAKKLHALSCLECGCCAYVCPARRPLVTSMRRAKKIIKEKGV
ncbi:MAG TPA: electron transport complex subunit RsxC [Clostridiales bacterium]|nr:electron transport complex subunit RsxC [Clostridiales bacterium]